MEYFFYYMEPRTNKISKDKSLQSTANLVQNTSSICKNWTTILALTKTTSKSFYIIFVDILFSSH